MKHIKHWLATMAVLLCSITASAYDFEVGGIYYNITSDTDLTVEITYEKYVNYSYSSPYSGNVVIPESVTYNSETYQVTSIEDHAFYKCSSLTSITIPESVTSIGEYAFSYCSSLTSIVVAEGNKVYDSRNGCNAIIETTSNTLIQGCATTIIPEGVTSIGGWAFCACSSLTSITLPESVTSIGEYAFEGCSSLTTVTIPENSQLTSIGGWAFYGCRSLTSITLPESVASIGNYAFSYCYSLAAITLPENSQLTSIGYYAFYECRSLTSITLPESVTSIGDDAFRECSLTSITIPEGVTRIGEGAFYKCRRLTSVTLPESVTSIGIYAFYECSSLTSITSKAIVPPVIEGGEVFRGIDKSIPVYVPVNSVTTYKNANYWRNFTNIIGMETSIENVENSEFTIQNSTLIYDLHGRCVAHPTKGGIYIVNGRKVVIK